MVGALLPCSVPSMAALQAALPLLAVSLVPMGIEDQPTALASEVRASETAGYAGSRIDLALLDATTRRLTLTAPNPHATDIHSTH